VETWAVTNEARARSWNGDQAVHWLVHQERYERMLALLTGHLLVSAHRTRRPGPSTSVAAPGPRPERRGGSQSKERPGVELSAAMLRQASRRAQEEGLTSVRTVAFCTATGVGNWLLRNVDPPTVALVSKAVQTALEPFVTPDGLLLGSRARLVTASRPWQ
jgi:hypothetical protein